MDSIREKKYLYIALIIIGTSPLGTLYVMSYVNYLITGGGPLLMSIFPVIIYPSAFYIHFYCFQRLHAVGYRKVDFFRFLIPIYGIYFAFQFASKLLSGEIQLPSSPKIGKGLSF